MNYFGEGHGKNCRDTHFSTVSKFVMDESLVRKLSTPEDVARAINDRQALTNENRISEGNVNF